MINIIDKECPMCESEISDLKISSEIDPIKNKDLLEKNWRGFYKDKIFFDSSVSLALLVKQIFEPG